MKSNLIEVEGYTKEVVLKTQKDLEEINSININSDFIPTIVYTFLKYASDNNILLNNINRSNDDECIYNTNEKLINDYNITLYNPLTIFEITECFLNNIIDNENKIVLGDIDIEKTLKEVTMQFIVCDDEVYDIAEMTKNELLFDNIKINKSSVIPTIIYACLVEVLDSGSDRLNVSEYIDFDMAVNVCINLKEDFNITIDDPDIIVSVLKTFSKNVNKRIEIGGIVMNPRKKEEV